jgi:hypothetical protein
MACSARLSEVRATLPLFECALLLRLRLVAKVTLLSREKGGSAMSRTLENGGWTSIAEQASKEMDSAKLVILVEKLCHAIDAERKQKSRLATLSKENEQGHLSGDLDVIRYHPERMVHGT